MKNVLKWFSLISVFAVLFVPLVVSQTMLFPFIKRRSFFRTEIFVSEFQNNMLAFDTESLTSRTLDFYPE
jgi:hypothetical protein